jgi:hypothetical protein
MFGNLVFHQFEKWHGKHGRSIPTAQQEEGERENECTNVIVSNTIIEPGTMMIHLHNASSAYGTMMASGRSPRVTFFAKTEVGGWILGSVVVDVILWQHYC